jgi:uncharacterized YkwD family protein/spore coat assembly protein SafA
MKKLFSVLLAAIAVFSLLPVHTLAASTTHTVVQGDTLWKIALRYQVGLSEIKSANPQIQNFDLIYPNQIINIPSQDDAVADYEQEVIRLVNEIRVQNGLKPLTYDWELARVARYKSQDMKDNRYFAHTSPVYGTPAEMVKSFGISYRSVGENIAKGYRTPQAVVNGWMNSSGHRANILNANYTRIGVGYVTDGNYWTQMFLSKRNDPPQKHP